AAASVALGTFLIGVSCVFVIVLITVGNISDDRFGPLLFLPVLYFVAGAVILLSGSGPRAGVRVGLAIGGAASILLLAWMLARGSRDWLAAPYGFDILLLIALEATGAYAGASTLGARGESPTAARAITEPTKGGPQENERGPRG
ncbi:MAG TPA: hypothetical protein VET26_03100, partial [Candidatus Sulfotelmatobacter sp.]|nr:hypothetical protein [Candidatus Sulfotelmatobacter sp.]